MMRKWQPLHNSMRNSDNRLIESCYMFLTPEQVVKDHIFVFNYGLFKNELKVLSYHYLPRVNHLELPVTGWVPATVL